MRSHDKRKYNQGRAFQQHAQEEVVDDLLIASMAVASTWCDDNNPSSSQPGVDDSSDSDDSTSDSSDSDADNDDSDGDEDVVDGQEEKTLDEADKEEDNTPKTSVSEAQKDTNSDDVDEEKQNNIQVAESTHKQASDDDDDSDIDLTENLANMLDEDEDLPAKKSSTKNQKSTTFKGPHTENEIDPYTCPTSELEKLNVSVGGNKHDIIATKIDDDGGIVVDESIRNSLKIAGTVRSHIVEQRTIVVDSFIPSPLQSQHDNLFNVALGEGSMLVIVTTKDEEGRNIASSLMGGDLNTSYSLQIIGKIMEVFGPVQRPLYVIRLPEPRTFSPEKDTKPKTDDTSKMKEDGQPDQPAESLDDKEAAAPPTADSNEITIEALEEEVETSHTDESDSKEDPWDAAGTLTTMIKSCSSTAVYCLMDHANLLDTDQIIRVSGKGCDASNMHDEEVGAKELEYSDDEEERQAKRKGKKKPARDNNDQRADTSRGRGAGRGSGRGDFGRGNNRGDRGNWKGGNGHNQVHQAHPQQPNYAYPPPNQMYQGYPPNQMHQGYPQNQMYQGHPPNQMYQAPPPQNFAHAQPTPYQNVPQYQQHQQYQQQHQYQPQQYQQQQYQQQQFQQQQYQQPYQQQQQYAPHAVPPPPPPPPPTQNQAQQTTESDTVYYDYSGS